MCWWLKYRPYLGSKKKYSKGKANIKKQTTKKVSIKMYVKDKWTGLKLCLEWARPLRFHTFDFANKIFPLIYLCTPAGTEGCLLASGHEKKPKSLFSLLSMYVTDNISNFVLDLCYALNCILKLNPKPGFFPKKVFEWRSKS